MICLPLPFFSWIQRKCVASSRLGAVSGRVRQPQGTFQEGSPNSPLIMTNSEERRKLNNLFECRKLFPPKFSAAPTARLTGEKGGVLFAVPRAAGGADTSQSESRGWGVLSTLTYAFLSVGAAAHKTWPILNAHSPNTFLKNKLTARFLFFALPEQHPPFFGFSHAALRRRLHYG